MSDINLQQKDIKICETIENAKTEKISELATLGGLNLAEDLVGIDLSGEDLSDDDLSGTDLSEANLSYTNLSGTDLSKANLSRADLTGANLSKANLSGANLTGANLSDVDLTNVNLTNTQFGNNQGLKDSFKPVYQSGETQGNSPIHSDLEVFDSLVKIALNQQEPVLQNLAKQVKKFPVNSKKQRVYLTQILNEIQQSLNENIRNKLMIPSSNDYIGQEQFNDNVQSIFILLSENINQYAPQELTFIDWFIKLIGDKENIDTETAIETNPSDSDSSSLTDLKKLYNWEDLRNLVEQDPTGRFKEKCINQKQKPNFQDIALLRLKRKSWETILEELDIDTKVTIQEIDYFYQECIEEFEPIFEEYLFKENDMNDMTTYIKEPRKLYEEFIMREPKLNDSVIKILSYPRSN